eukprot:scaffold2816_cov105-Isochrysis_galbana.AAC.2
MMIAECTSFLHHLQQCEANLPDPARSHAPQRQSVARASFSRALISSISAELARYASSSPQRP